MKEYKEVSVLEDFEKDYLSSENKNDLDYWSPYSKIIIESIELRDQKALSQKALAKTMNTTQSVISRFENMGRLPSYDFVARLSQSLGHSLGMTLMGDFMAVVPIEKQNFIVEESKKKNISTNKFIQGLLNESIEKLSKPNPINLVTSDEADNISFNIFPNLSTTSVNSYDRNKNEDEKNNKRPPLALAS